MFGWWKRRKKKAAQEKFEEAMKAMGWKVPVIKWSPPDVLRFQLSAHDESGKEIKNWYLGTRGRNEPVTAFMLVAYGLTETPSREVGRGEAIQLWSKWLSLSLSLAADFIPWIPWEEQMFLFEDWANWAQNNVENREVAKKQIASLPNSCTFRVSAS